MYKQLTSPAVEDADKDDTKKAVTGKRSHGEVDKASTPGRSKRSKSKSEDPESSKKAKAQGGKKSNLATSTIRYDQIGGIDDILQEVREIIEYPIRHPEIFVHLGVEPPRGVLLHGPPGCGKTMLANAMAGELGVPFLKKSAPELVTGMSGESEKQIRELFAEAAAQAPCILFLDEIDAITPKRQNAAKDMERRIVAQLLTCMDEIAFDKTGSKAVIVIGATNRPDAIDDALRRAGRFDREISLGIPDEKARSRILQTMCQNMRLEGDFDYDEIAHLTPGFVGADLSALTKEAAVIAINRIFKGILGVGGMSDNAAAAAAATALFATKQEEATPASKELPASMFDDKEGGEETDNDAPTEPAEPAAPAEPEAPAEPAAPAEGTGAGDAEDQVDAMDTEEPLQEDKGNLEHRNQAEMDVKRRASVSDFMRDSQALTAEELAPLAITMDDFREATNKVQPSSKREGFTTVPDVNWEQVGALGSAKAELRMCITEPIRDPDRYVRLGIATPAGVCLYGPPGCGKTLVAKAVAKDAGANFISVKGPELLNKYVGESERAVRQVFSRAQASSPCIIFFDEMDALCPRRGGDGNQATERVVNQLLTELDGIETRRQVFVIAATNRPDIMDPAILRPGRLDKLICVHLPDADGRVDILKAVSSKTPLDPMVDLDKVARDSRCDGFSGADLAALAREAALETIRHPNTSGNRDIVRPEHFEAALNLVKRSVTAEDAKRCLMINQKSRKGN